MTKTTDRIKTWGQQNWWHMAIVGAAGALISAFLVSPLAVKYLPPSVINIITTAVTDTHVVAVGVSDSVVVSGTVIQ